MTPRRVLFLCSRHRLRSPTAAAMFGRRSGLEVDSAGLADDAETRLDAAQLDWADRVLVMAAHHARRLHQRFGPWLRGKRVVSLDTPDRDGFMQPELVVLLEQRGGPLLR